MGNDTKERFHVLEKCINIFVIFGFIALLYRMIVIYILNAKNKLGLITFL